MKNELNIKLSATLDKHALECIIKEALEQETGKQVKSISFSVTKTNEDERYGYYTLSGCTVDFETSTLNPKMPTGPTQRGTTRC